MPFCKTGQVPVIRWMFDLEKPFGRLDCRFDMVRAGMTLLFKLNLALFQIQMFIGLRFLAAAMRWIPLEANPEFIYNLGVKPAWEFVDVYGLDPELLSMVPRPVLAVVLLYPLSDSNTESLGKPVDSTDVFLVKQTIDNACGTIALLHAVMNNENVLQFKDGRKDLPVLHGPTSPDTLLEDTATVIKKFMAEDPESINYAVVALCKKH
ncbi:ubiquitin carboxyl-terminal hydrolase L3 [Paragonimus westermani]|uniref:Ubiquitin carboxyl-terminal hydrolase n=1 Tax=Paragonimus westermani TaxID=34504 RepID=A0A5J4NIT8_9TREM|nr:ubiquitin carboxyl-terminal hydrolase L3 [Paragonimus westermani]